MTVGIVTIGRNEGDRLRRCLTSVTKPGMVTVYVDSGSTDGSPDVARSLGVHVVHLDMSIPFTAARGRNAGFDYLMEIAPDTDFVQFIDGDCEMRQGWLEQASARLAADPQIAVVCGRRRERLPDASIYNRLCDIEWDTPIGETQSCGGDSMIRTSAFQATKGFDPSVAAGEEPELCSRLLGLGWKVVRMDGEMTLHDAAMLRFAQWWKRQVRTGYGALDVAKRFGLPFYKHLSYRARFWSAWPLFALASGLIAGSAISAMAGVLAAVLVCSIWPAQLFRIALRSWRSGLPRKIAFAYAWYTMISFWPQMLGQMQYWIDQLLRRPIRLIEYKSPSRALDQHK